MCLEMSLRSRGIGGAEEGGGGRIREQGIGWNYAVFVARAHTDTLLNRNKIRPRCVLLAYASVVRDPGGALGHVPFGDGQASPSGSKEPCSISDAVGP